MKKHCHEDFLPLCPDCEAMYRELIEETGEKFGFDAHDVPLAVVREFSARLDNAHRNRQSLPAGQGATEMGEWLRVRLEIGTS
jgi:hypothetical protein